MPIFFLTFILVFIHYNLSYAGIPSTDFYYKTEKEILSYPYLFYHEISDQWDYVCPDDQIKNDFPHIVSHMKHYSGRVIYEGLKVVENLNPELAYFSVRNALDRWLTVSCEKVPGGGVAALLKRPFISDKLFIGKIVPSLMALPNDYRQPWPKMALLLKLGFAKNPPDLENSYQAVGLAMFHEFLHFTRSENFSREEHNKLQRMQKQDDIPYACSAQAFPYAKGKESSGLAMTIVSLKWNEDRLFSYTNTQRACMTCASTLVGSDQLTPHEKYLHLIHANDVCANLDETDYEFEVTTGKDFFLNH